MSSMSSHPLADDLICCSVSIILHTASPNPLPLSLSLSQCLKDSKESSKAVLEPRLAEMAESVCPHCSHVETNVRKQAIFCLVELLLLFGPDRIDPHLKNLTVSQVTMTTQQCCLLFNHDNSTMLFIGQYPFSLQSEKESCISLALSLSSLHHAPVNCYFPVALSVLDNLP